MSRVPPVRTCVGCRGRAAKSDLLRVVVDPRTGAVVPDEHARLAGRGAYLHPVPACLDQAERRRALSRALRLAGALDTAAVRGWLEANGRRPCRSAAPTTEGKQSSDS